MGKGRIRGLKRAREKLQAFAQANSDPFHWEDLLLDIPDTFDDDDVEFVACAWGKVLDRIDEVSIGDLHRLIARARDECNIKMQPAVIRAALYRICGFDPHAEQIRVLRRLIFGKGDTLLIAKTGWGKSVIFQAYSVLTRKITLQIIPLIKLGDEQAASIAAIPGTRVCLITRDTRRSDQGMFKRIEEGYYTHILLGPEQASQPAFRSIIKKPEVQANIGLVAIDECHVIKQWEAFRPEFTMLNELRILLRRDVVWFACSATMERRTEHVVLNHAGFRRVGVRPYQTEVIRTSINREDICICVRPLPRSKTTSPDTLFFAIEDAFQGSKATPSRIKKTVVFIDSKADIQRATQYLRTTLVFQSQHLALADRYFHGTPCGHFRDRCVEDVVQVYTSSVSTYDQDRRYGEFKTEASKIRIMVATTSLGMGVNIPDIARVILWRFPIGCDIADVQQRIGRGGRGSGRTSEAYILIPYWCFESEGFEAEDSAESQLRDEALQPSTPRPRTVRGRIQKSYPRACARAPSSSQTELRSRPLLSQVSQTPLVRQHRAVDSQRKPWTLQELHSRRQVPATFLEMVNSPCHRAVILRELGEFRLPANVVRSILPKELCCSGCNPQLFPEFPSPPPQDSPLRVPQKGTKAAVALQMIDDWAVEQAETIHAHPGRRFVFAPDAFLEAAYRWRIAHLYTQATWGREDVVAILGDVEIHPWAVTEGAQQDFVNVLQGWVSEVKQKHDEQQQRQREDNRKKRAAKLLESLRAGLLPDPPSPLTGRTSSQDPAELTEQQIRRDEALVREAVMKAIKSRGGFPSYHPLRQSLTPMRNASPLIGTPSISSAIVRCPTASPSIVRSAPRPIRFSPVFARARAACDERRESIRQEQDSSPKLTQSYPQLEESQEEQILSMAQLEGSQIQSQEHSKGGSSSDDGLHDAESPVRVASVEVSQSQSRETGCLRKTRQNKTRQSKRRLSLPRAPLEPRSANSKVIAGPSSPDQPRRGRSSKLNSIEKENTAI